MKTILINAACSPATSPSTRKKDTNASEVDIWRTINPNQAGKIREGAETFIWESGALQQGQGDNYPESTGIQEIGVVSISAN